MTHIQNGGVEAVAGMLVILGQVERDLIATLQSVSSLVSQEVFACNVVSLPFLAVEGRGL